RPQKITFIWPSRVVGYAESFGRYTQILVAAGKPSVVDWPSPDAVMVPAHGATSLIFTRRPGRTFCRHRYSSRSLSASASSVIRSTTTVVPSLACASGNGDTRTRLD